MKLEQPTWVDRAALDALRRERFGEAKLQGLWAAGSLEALRGPCIAVVGSRAPSEAGRARATAFGVAFARAGVCVISGLALGIDAAAHVGALEAGGPTVGVLGGGHKRFFPPRNRPLAQAMLAAGGAVISPYPPDAPARPWQFLQRNGVIAALVDAVVVVEAAERSGSLNTASWASANSTPVFAVPGDVDRAKAAGCNALIRDFAVLVRDPDDVLADLGLRERAPDAERGPSDAAIRVPFGTDAELVHRIDRALSLEALDLDNLFTRLQASHTPPSLTFASLVATLALLEVDGLVRRDGGRYARASNALAR